MVSDHAISVENVDPTTAWETLSADGSAALVDCRTELEWGTIGVPDLSGFASEVHLIEWRQQPDMQVNRAFMEHMDERFGGTYPDKIYFLCRSGARSLEAATYVQNQLASRDISCVCINVAEGFEGDPGPSGVRGIVNGWKFHGLPWEKG